MSLTTHTDGPFLNFKETTLDALLGLEGYLVELDTGEGTVKLATSGANSIGILSRKTQGNPHVQVTALGAGVTCKCKAGGVIAKGGLVMWVTGGKVGAASGTARTFGRKVDQGSSANNDIIEVMLETDTVTIA